MNPWRISFRISGEIEIYPPPPDGGTTAGGVIIFTTQKGSHMGEITVKADETKLAATARFEDSEHNPTTPDTIPVWAVGDEDVLTVTASPDGMSATFHVGSPGVSSVTCTAQETHDGVGEPLNILLSGLVTVEAGNTVTGSIEFTVGGP